MYLKHNKQVPTGQLVCCFASYYAEIIPMLMIGKQTIEFRQRQQHKTTFIHNYFCVSNGT